MSVAPANHAPSTVTAPALPAEFVRRPRLVERLQSGRPDALRVIVGPPGYGKSSLVAEWAQDDGRRFAWLRFGPPDLAEDAEDLIAGAIAWVRCADEPCLVALDDAHLLTRAQLRDAIASIEEHAPAGSTIAVIARSEPDLPLGRLRAHRGLIEVGVTDLALTPAEAAALLHGSGLTVDFTDVQTLVRRTEGWPAALYLAALSLGQPTLGPCAIADFRGDDHLLAEYLRDEVLESLPSASMVFLRRTSVLDELTGPVCDVTVGRSGSARRLAALAKSTSLLEAIDPAHDRYRWHPLFREALAAELRRREPELTETLHARASAWYADHGSLDAAIEHAVEAADAQRTGQLMWGNFASFLTAEGIGKVERWIAPFAHDATAENPALALSAAGVALAEGRAETAFRYSRELAAAVEPLRDRASELTVAGDLIAAVTGPGGVGAMQVAARRGSETLPANSPWRAACAYVEGAALHLGGADAIAAARLFDEAAALSGREFPMLCALALCYRALLAVEAQEWPLAVDLTDQADALLTTHGCELPITALALGTIAAARAHEGRAAEAKHDVHRASAALEGVDDTLAWFGAMTRLLLAHASLHLADVATARTLLAQASRQARRAGDVASFSWWFGEAWAYLDSIAETTLTGPSALTIAELRVLRFLPSCRTFREIAAQLGVSANTVKTQAHAVYRKLGAASRSEAVLLARDAGLLGS